MKLHPDHLNTTANLNPLLSCVGRLFSVHFTRSGLIEAFHGDKLYGALGGGMALSGGGGQTKNNSWQRIRIERSKKDDYCVVVWPTRNAIITMTTKRIPVQSYLPCGWKGTR